MSKLSASLLPQVVKAINEYGIEVTVYRNVYENQVGVRTLVKSGLEVATLKVVIDNSNGSSSNSNYKKEGIVVPKNTATIYYAYSEDIKLERDDFIIIDGVKYILSVPQNLLHYNILYQVVAEVVVK